MSRWLWRRYAITDEADRTLGSTRAIRSVNALSDMCGDCIDFCSKNKMNYIGYTLKGMKRLCVKLQDKGLTDICDSMTDLYIRGQYAQMPEMLSAFNTELNRVRSSSGFGMLF